MTTVELKAFVDESGTHDSGLTVVAGWLGYADRWAAFESKWRSILVLNGLRHVHAIDLKQGKKHSRTNANGHSTDVLLWLSNSVS